MSGLKGTKINQILKTWPQGTVAATCWLEANGVYHQLAHNYEQSAWIKRIGHGAYIRDGDHVDWQGAVYAVQRHLKLHVHVAAKTALELQGVVHFVPARSNGRSIYLFGAGRTKLPMWFKQYNWEVGVHFMATDLFSMPKNLGFIEKNMGTYSIRISSRERAALELLHLVLQEQDYEESKLLFEGLRTLRPDLVQKLLEHCRSIKAKRLFLHLADATNQPWVKELKFSRIYFGKGKRVIAGGGVFDSKYNISVPKISQGGEKDGVEGP